MCASQRGRRVVAEGRERLLERRVGLVVAAARELEVRRPPEGARIPPAIAGAPEEVAGVRELGVGPVELAGDRVDEPEARERHADPTALAQAAAQLERALQRGPRRVEVALGELEVGAAHEHGGEAAVLVG